MTGSIILGVLVALMFLVSFTEWFYHIVTSLNVVVIQDIYAVYRASGWVVGALAFMAGVFWVLATVNECPREEPKAGVFQYLNCGPYLEARDMLIERGIIQPETPDEISSPDEG